MEQGNKTTVEEPLVKRRLKLEPDCLFLFGQYLFRAMIFVLTFASICLIVLSHDALPLIGFRYLLCADVIVCCYTLLSLAWFWSPWSKDSDSNSYMLVFYCDQVALMLLSCGCYAAAPVGEQHATGWYWFCSGACTKTSIALDWSRGASFCFLSLFMVVIFRLLCKAYL